MAASELGAVVAMRRTGNGGRSAVQEPVEAALSSGSGSGRAMNLKGASPDMVVGRRITVLYDEGGDQAVPYEGVVTFAQRGRLYVAFDGFDESEGAWIDDSDDWSWNEEDAPRAHSPSPIWRLGHLPPPVEKIFLVRNTSADRSAERALDGGEEVAANAGKQQFLVKWKGRAHVHCQWVDRNALEVDPANKQRVQRFLKALSSMDQSGENTWQLAQDGDNVRADDEPYNPEFNLVERIVAEQRQLDDTPPKYLVKWRSLPYASCTWESALTLVDDQQAIRRFRQFEQAPTAAERRVASQGLRPPRSNWQKLTSSPVFKGGNTLRPYQLEGLNWLLFSWYCRRSVMLADEMGLGKTVQSVATLQYIWQRENIRGPFLVVAPLSTLSHWQREFDLWTEMNAIVYHGSTESREILRQYEFFFADSNSNPATQDAYKFHALITSYEVVKLDLDRFRKIPWRYLVIDEAHRLKNKDSALATDLRSLRVEHMHLLSGTPLQNNTTELWALLSFLDPQLFPTLEGFLREYGTLTDSGQVERLNEKIRPYLLRRQKNDVEKSLTPLEETIIWVEMTIYQKKCYKAILEGNRDILVRGVSNASMPSLVNMQMELRKCCNHPYLIKGVEASQVEGMQQEEELDALLRASGKYVLLDKLLPKLKAEGHRVLIFSQMVRMLDMLSEFLIERRYSHERLDGTIRGDLRQAAIDRFCKPGSDTFIFLLSTRAGGLGINLTAADTCIIFDSDWNPQNDVQAMARSHRIGQNKTVKVFRLVTRNTYESEMVERANKKLGLERAMNADRGGDGLRDGPRSGPTQDRNEIDEMLRRGAHDIFINESDDTAFQKFNQADINEILQSSSTRISYNEQDTASGSVFAKASFIADDNAVDMDDPEFWTKILPELEQKDAALADYFIKRKTKQVKRFGMAEEGEEEDFDDGKRIKKDKGGRNRDEDEAKRAAKRALAHVWSKTERMNCERALLSFGFGRWGRIKDAAQGGTKMRSEYEVAQFGVAFICLCVGVPIGAVGTLGNASSTAAAGEEVTAASAAEAEGILKARELLTQMGCALPILTKAQVIELEPLVSAGGSEYAERVHKLGHQMIARLLALKRLADSVEREADPLANYRAPPVHGGVGRDPAVRWTPRDDALLLLGVYKWGYRAYEEVRDDTELPFTCRTSGRTLPKPLAPASAANGADAGFDSADELPVPPGVSNGSLTTHAQPASQGPGMFLQEKEYRERVKALMDAVGERERLREDREEEEAEWEAEWQREQRGEISRPAKLLRTDGSTTQSQLQRLWTTCGIPDC